MRRYLIVDDNRAFAENLAEILRDARRRGRDGRGRAPRRSQLARRHALRRAPHRHAHAADGRRRAGARDPAGRSRRRGDGRSPPTWATTTWRPPGARGCWRCCPSRCRSARVLELLGAARRDGLVVVVEDDPALSDNLCEVLRSRGFAAVTAALGARDRAARAGAALLRAGGPAGAGRAGRRGDAAARRALPGPADDRGHRATTTRRRLRTAALFTKPFDTGALLAARRAAPRGPRREAPRA